MAEEILREVPLWVVLRRAKRVAIRPVARPPKVVKTWVLGGYNRNSRYLSHEMETKDVRGNLSREEYRMWEGEVNTAAKWRRCRACGLSGYTIESRHETWNEHVKKHKCTVVVDGAAKLLARDSKCVVCNKHTSAFRWGFPLCCRRCENEFKFTVPQALEDAVDLVRKSMGMRMRGAC